MSRTWSFSKENRPLALTILLLLTASCAKYVNRIEVGQEKAVALYDRPYSIGCDDAFRHAVKSMHTLSYRVVKLERSASGGEVDGLKEGTTGVLTITCGASGVLVKSSVSGGWAEQGLQFTFDQVVQNGDRMWPPPTAPRVAVEMWKGIDSKAWFSREIESWGVVAARVKIVNGGTRPLTVNPAGILGIASGGRAQAIAGTAAKAKLAGEPGLDAILLGPVRLAQGQTAAGFVFFPNSDYQTVSIPVTDEPTGETDQYDFAVPPPVQ